MGYWLYERSFILMARLNGHILVMMNKHANILKMHCQLFEIPYGLSNGIYIHTYTYKVRTLKRTVEAIACTKWIYIYTLIDKIGLMGSLFPFSDHFLNGFSFVEQTALYMHDVSKEFSYYDYCIHTTHFTYMLVAQSCLTRSNILCVCLFWYIKSWPQETS
jgi:hypothetical protein